MLLFKIALKYLWSGRFSTRLITAIAFLGTFLASFALVFTVGIMNGFERAVKEGLLKNLPHIQIFVEDKNEIPRVEEKVKEVLKGNVRNLYWYAAYGLIFQKGPYLTSAVVYASTEEILRKFLSRRFPVIEGNLENNCLVVGYLLASKLGIYRVPDTVLLIDPVARKTPVGFIPKVKQIKVCGIFYSGYTPYDGAAMAPYGTLAGKFTPSFFAVVVDLTDPYEADYFRGLLSEELPDEYISTWMDGNREFFAALKLQKLGMILVVGLIAVVASFNITALLFMKVRELRKDFAIFRTYGLGKALIFRVVLVIGALIGALGGGLGVVLSFTAAVIFTEYRLIKVPEEVYLTSYLPVEPGIFSSFAVFLAVLFLSVAAALLPAYVASKEKITEILRND